MYTRDRKRRAPADARDGAYFFELVATPLGGDRELAMKKLQVLSDQCEQLHKAAMRDESPLANLPCQTARQHFHAI